MRCVIAKSFAFIFGRNMPSLGLLGFVVPEDSGFWDVAWDGGEGSAAEEREIEVDVETRTVRVNVEGEGWREWGFELSGMELGLIVNQGLTTAFGRFGRGIWEEMMKGEDGGMVGKGTGKVNKGLQNAGLLEEGEGKVEKEIAW